MKEPCNQCPYRRTSLAGYLGNSSRNPEAFLHVYHETNTKHVCHKRVNWDAPSKQEVQEQYDRAPVCVGYATMCTNELKMPKNRDGAELVAMTKTNHDLVFSNSQEFINHHKGIL